MLWLKFLPTQNEWTFTLILKGLFTNSIQFAGPAIFIFQLYLFSEANWRFYSNFFWHKMSEHLHWSQGLKRYVLDLCDIFQVCILEKRHLCGREDSESYICERKSMALQSHFQVRRGTCLGLTLHQVRIECIRTFKCGCIVVTVHCRHVLGWTYQSLGRVHIQCLIRSWGRKYSYEDSINGNLEAFIPVKRSMNKHHILNKHVLSM